LRLKAYWDIDAWAVCYGNRSHEGETTTKEDCESRLRSRIGSVFSYVKDKFGEDFTDNQLVALVSLYFNVRDPEHVEWRIKNDMSNESVANAFRMYVVADGQRLPGLEKRRKEEANLFLK